MLYSENTWWIDIGVFSSGWDDFVLLLFFGRPESFDPGLSKIPEASILESILSVSESELVSANGIDS
jgi:hypothetical protein